MKAKILSMALALCMIVSLVAVFPASADDITVTAVCDDTTVIDHLSYSDCYNSNNSTSGPGAMGKDGDVAMIVRIGDFVEYTLDVKEAGYYNLGINSQAHNINLQRWDAFVDGVKQCEFATWYMDWNDVVGDVYLPAGRHTLKLVPTAGHTWKYLLGITLTRKTIQEKAYWTIGKDYTETTGRLEGDKVVLQKDTYADYKVNVEEAGTYLLSLQHRWNFHSLVTDITVNGTTRYPGASLTGAYHSDATRSADYLTSPVAMIELNAGENTVRIENTTDNGFYVISFFVEKSEGAVISASNYDSTTGTGALEGGALKLGYGITASYDVEIPETGTYLVSAWSGSTANTVGIYNVWVDGAQKATKGFLFPDWRGNIQELCVVDLEKGTRTITIGASNNTSTHYFKTLLVQKIDDSKTLTQDNAIEIEDEIKNVIDAKDCVNECSHDALTLSESGNLTLAPCAKVAYKLNVLRDGIYTVSLKYATGVNGVIANVKADGITVSSTRLEASAESAMLTYELGDITLTKGLHEIEILNSNSTNGPSYPIYLGELYLERKTRPEEAIYVSARDYVSVTDGTEGDTATGIEGVGIALRNTDSVHYNVFFPEAGVYRLDIMCGSSTVNYNIYIDDELMDWVSNVLPKRYTAGLNEQVMQSICDVYIGEAGVHKVTIENPTGAAHYLAGFKFDKIAGEEEASIIHLASDYLEAYDAANGTNAAGVEGGNVTFGTGDTLTYDASTFTEGWYELSMLVSREVVVNSDVTVSINDEPATFAGQTTGSGSWSVVGKSVLGKIYLPAGSNTIKLTAGEGGTYYLYAVILEPVVLEETTTISGNTTEVELQPMLGVQEGAEHMVAGYVDAVRIYEGKTATYDLNVLEAGTYKVRVQASQMVVPEIKINVAVGDASEDITYANSKGTTYVAFKSGEIELAEGANTISVTALTCDIALCELALEKVTDEVEFELVRVKDSVSIKDNGIISGDYILNVYGTNDEMAVFAIYKTDANGVKKLETVNMIDCSATVDSSEALAIDDITVGEGETYSAKAFLWDADTYYGESAEY